MNAAQLSFLLIVFGIVCALAWLGMMLFAPVALRTRLRRFIGKSDTTALEPDGWVERVARVTQPLTKLSLPEEGWEKSVLRTRFMNAGWRNPVAPTLFFASKTVLALLGPATVGVLVGGLVILLSGGSLLFLLLLTATIGYYLPNLALAVSRAAASAKFSRPCPMRSTC
jgi:tight adherence protein C